MNNPAQADLQSACIEIGICNPDIKRDSRRDTPSSGVFISASDSTIASETQHAPVQVDLQSAWKETGICNPDISKTSPMGYITSGWL